MAHEVDIEELQPLDEELLDAEEELAAAEHALDDESDVTVEVEPEPVPIGRGIAFDFATNRVVLGGHGPLETRRDASIRTWIHKCLLTHEGAHPIHPDGYGLPNALSEYLGDPLPDLGQLERDISDALLFHPSITEVRDFEAVLHEVEGGDAAVEVRFVAEIDDGSDLEFATTLGSGEVL